MIHEPGDVIIIPADSVDWAWNAPEHSKLNDGQKMGLALDEFVKRAAMRRGMTICSKYANCDIQSGDLMIEIKSSLDTSRTFTFSHAEYGFIKNRCITEDKQYKVLFYINSLLYKATFFIGTLDAKLLFDGILKASTFDNSWYVELSQVKRLLHLE